MKLLTAKIAIKLFQRVPFQAEHTAQAIDLLSRLLVFEPSHRISIEEAMSHPFLASLHDPSDEPSCPNAFSLPYDIEDLEIPLLKALFLDEMQPA